MRRAWAAALLVAGMASSAGAAAVSLPAGGAVAPPAWIDEVQTWCMVPLLPERARAMRVTVNGLWGGMGGAQPVISAPATVRGVPKAYGKDDAAFCLANHAQGLRVVAIVPGLEGNEALRAIAPNLDDMACRGADGMPRRVGDDMTLMCVNNPSWLAWQLAFGKQGIDSGADLVLFDTPMSASFISGFLKGGFCDCCLEGFRRHLERLYAPEALRERFGLASFDRADVIRRLSPLQEVANPQNRPFLNTSPDDLLFREFIRFKEMASYSAVKVVTSGLRAYAAERGRPVAIAGNIADLGMCNPMSHWIRGLMFADLFDVYAYEQNHLVSGQLGEKVTPYPRGKWVPAHKLAYAIRHRRAPAVLHAGGMGALLQESLRGRLTFNTWMAVQCAEAYACGGAYALYQVEPSRWVKLQKSFWRDAITVNDFVLNHRDLYDGPLVSGAALALVYLMSERGRTIPGVCPSYVGFANALTEGNCPFDVVFGGDGFYVRDNLTTEALAPYRALIVPSPLSPTPGQAEALRAFVRHGGTLVCQEPDRLGLTPDTGTDTTVAQGPVAREFHTGDGLVKVLAGTVTATEVGDVGEHFQRQYDDASRADILELARDLGARRLLARPADGLVGAFAWQQANASRVVVHLVNYDIDMDADAIRPKADVGVTLERPAYLAGDLRGEYLAIGEDTPVAVSLTCAPGAISCSVPELRWGGTLVIGAAGTLER